MKRRLLLVLGIVGTIAMTFASCDKEDPALTVEGDYYGSFEGFYNDQDTLTSEGYMVQVKMLNDNKIRVTGNDFDSFELLVTSNGLNVEPVTQADPNLEEFLYIGSEEKLRFTYNKDGNSAEFIGLK